MPRKNTDILKQKQSRPLQPGEKLHYIKSMVKKKGKIYWRVTEKPTNVIVKDCFFEQDARTLVRFQNKNRVWENNGGIPHFLCDIQPD
jgi:aromatic ring-opening dioxygenase catalytic subunit (LigB family)